MEPDLDTLLETLPASPGVYLMKNARGEIIYVGKAKSLRNRVRSYFQQPEKKDTKTRLLVGHIHTFDYIVTHTEKEALIAENNLIKKHRPRYNIDLRDDKNYLSLRLALDEAFPRLVLVRKIRRDKAKYFGPYDSAHAVRNTLRLINRVFQLRTCSPEEFRNRSRPCRLQPPEVECDQLAGMLNDALIVIPARD